MERCKTKKRLKFALIVATLLLLAGIATAKDYRFHGFDVYIDSLLSVPRANISDLNVTSRLNVGDNIFLNATTGNISGIYLKGLLQCDQITGTADNLCIDATGADGHLSAWINDIPTLSLNGTYTILNISNGVNLTSTGNVYATNYYGSAFYDDNVQIVNYDDSDVRSSIVLNVSSSLKNNTATIGRDAILQTVNITSKIQGFAGTYILMSANGDVDVY